MQRDAEANAEAERTRAPDFKTTVTAKPFKFSSPLPSFFDRQAAMTEKRNMTFDERYEALQALQG